MNSEVSDKCMLSAMKLQHRVDDILCFQTERMRANDPDYEDAFNLMLQYYIPDIRSAVEELLSLDCVVSVDEYRDVLESIDDFEKRIIRLKKQNYRQYTLGQRPKEATERLHKLRILGNEALSQLYSEIKGH